MDIRTVAMGLAFSLMWSSAFTSARIIVADASPLYALTLRFLISGAIGVGLAVAMGQSWRLTPAQWKATILFGVCQNALYLGLNFVAMQQIEASLAAIIASSLPLLVGLLGWLLFRDTLTPLSVAGLLVGILGVALIMGSRLTDGVDAIGILYCVLAVLALTFATLAVRGASSGGNLMMIVGLQMLVGGAVLGAAAVVFETPRLTVSVPLIVAFAYTTLVPGLLATWVWFNLVNRVGAVRAATFHFLNPFFGVAIAAVLLGEALGPLDVIGVAVVTVAILVVQLQRQRPSP